MKATVYGLSGGALEIAGDWDWLMERARGFALLSSNRLRLELGWSTRPELDSLVAEVEHLHRSGLLYRQQQVAFPPGRSTGRSRASSARARGGGATGLRGREIPPNHATNRAETIREGRVNE